MICSPLLGGKTNGTIGEKALFVCGCMYMCFIRICTRMLLVCYSFVTRVLFICIYSSNVTHMYIRIVLRWYTCMLLLCICMLLVCYSYVLVWCLSDDHRKSYIYIKITSHTENFYCRCIGYDVENCLLVLSRLRLHQHCIQCYFITLVKCIAIQCQFM